MKGKELKALLARQDDEAFVEILYWDTYSESVETIYPKSLTKSRYDVLEIDTTDELDPRQNLSLETIEISRDSVEFLNTLKSPELQPLFWKLNEINALKLFRDAKIPFKIEGLTNGDLTFTAFIESDGENPKICAPVGVSVQVFALMLYGLFNVIQQTKKFNLTSLP